MKTEVRDSDEPSTPGEHVARRFHETYERLAPSFGYKTREASAVAWECVPEKNKSLMIAVAKSLIDQGVIALPAKAVDPVRDARNSDEPQSVAFVKNGPDRHQLTATGMKQLVVQLWGLLDDIDTQDDASKSDDAHFRRSVYAIQQKRHVILNGDTWDRLRKGS